MVAEMNTFAKDYAIYEDFKEFFESDMSIEYVVAIFTKRDMLAIIEKMLQNFIQNEDYEKCAELIIWKEKVEKITDCYDKIIL